MNKRSIFSLLTLAIALLIERVTSSVSRILFRTCAICGLSPDPATARWLRLRNRQHLIMFSQIESHRPHAGHFRPARLRGRKSWA
jgi:hypothetical protein